MITKDSVIARRSELDRQRLDCVATLNAIVGAMQDCEFWLKKLDEPEKPAEPAQVVEFPKQEA